MDGTKDIRRGTAGFLTRLDEQIGPWLFYSGLVLFLLSRRMYFESDAQPGCIAQIQYIFGLLGRGLLYLRLLTALPKRPLRTVACLSLLAVFVLSAYLNSSVGVPLYNLALIVMASRGADIKIALKLWLAYALFNLVMCPSFLALGWAADIVKHKWVLTGHSFGFRNPNALGVIVMMTILAGLFLLRERRGWVVWLVCWCAAALVLFVSLTLTQVAVLLALPLFYLLLSRVKVPAGIVAALPAACLILSVILCYIYGPGYGNNTFESRFSIGALLYGKAGLSLLGQDCGLKGWVIETFPYYLTLDNAYLRLFLCNGVLVGAMVLILMSQFLWQVAKRGDALTTAFAATMAVEAMMEAVPFVVDYCFLPLLFMHYFEKSAPAHRRGIEYLSFALAIAAAVYVLFNPICLK